MKIKTQNIDFHTLKHDSLYTTLPFTCCWGSACSAGGLPYPPLDY